MRSGLPLPLRMAALVTLAVSLAAIWVAGSPDLSVAWLGVNAQSGWLLQILFGAHAIALVFAWIFMGKPLGSHWWRVLGLQTSLVFVYGVGVLDAFLVGYMLVEGQFDRWWLLVLLIPIALSAWTGFGRNSATRPEPEKTAESEPGPQAQFIAREAIETPGKILTGSAVSIATSVVVLIASLGGLLVGSVLLGLLRRVLFEGAALTPDLLEAMTRTPEWASALATLIVVPVIITIVYGIIAIGSALALARATRDPDRFNRVLLPGEEDFLDQATEALVNYAEAQKYPRVWALAPLVMGLGGIALAVALCFALSGAIIIAIRLAVLPDELQSGFMQNLVGVSLILSLFAGPVASWPLMQKLSERHARFAEHLYVRHGWNTTRGQARTPDQYFVELETDLRLDKLNAKERFDPASYLQHAFRRRSSFSVKAGTLALSICLGFAVLDGFAYQAFGEEAALQSGYFEFSQNTYRYDTATAIDTACYVGTNDGQPALRVTYHLVMPDGVSLNLSDFLAGSSLERLERIDAQASLGGAERRAGERRGVGQSGRPALDPDCLSRLRARFGSDTPRVRRLLNI